jgi:prophage antirepressor-like protein
MKDLNIETKFKNKFINLKVGDFTPPPNFQKNTYFVNESGLYQLLTKSSKPMAKTF